MKLLNSVIRERLMNDKKKKKLTGNETMKRRTPDALSLRPLKFESDPKIAYSQQQLSEIGAIAIKWNQIEAHVEFISTFILLNKSPLWLRISISEKINSKNKLDILKEFLAHTHLLDADVTNRINQCIAKIAECRSYRNAIIHHHIYDHEKGIGSHIDYSNSTYQILVTIDALSILYKNLCCLLDELREVDLLIRIETDAQRPGQLNQKTGEFKAFDDQTLKTKVIPLHLEKLKSLQKKRQDITPLPRFPDADLIKILALNEQNDL